MGSFHKGYGSGENNGNGQCFPCFGHCAIKFTSIISYIRYYDNAYISDKETNALENLHELVLEPRKSESRAHASNPFIEQGFSKPVLSQPCYDMSLFKRASKE